MPGGAVEVDIVPNLRDFPGKLGSGLKGITGVAATLGKGLGVAIASGAAVAAVGLKSAIDLGIEYQNNLNELGAVTGATGFQMAAVGKVAKELGSDLSLPGTSAADAAAAMKELAKGGLSVDDAMTAAKGTLQLAAAAQIEAAQAAEIQSDALNQFGLSADNAGHVADVLANTANAASGEITDMANALKYVGPVARGLGVDIDNTAAAIGLLAVNGIRGEQAGTSLRGILASLASPSKEAAKAMDALGISAFDQTGKFVGLRTITEQLAAAKGKMTDAEFAAAAATAFGNEGFTAANALALSGAPAFDKMAESVSKAGGAAEVSAAKAKGLGGAWDGLKSQLETTGIEIFEAIDGPLEKLVRGGAEKIDQFGKVVVDGLNTAVAAGEVYGPRLAAAISSRASVVGTAISSVLGPIAAGAVGPLNESINTVIELWDDFTAVLKNVVDAAKPVANGISELGKAAADGDGPVSALGAGFGLLGGAVKIASAVLVPLGQFLGGIVSAFASLPGPIQSAALAFVAFKVASNIFSDTKLFSGVRQFSDEMSVQRGLATQNGEAVGRLGSAMAAFNTSTVPAVAAARSFRDQTVAIREGAAAAGQPIGLMSAAMGTLVERSPALSAMREAFDSASQGAERFGTAAGVAAAAGSGLRSLGSGLVSALGGPFGIAMAAASVGLSLLGSKQEEAAAAAAKHKTAVDGLASALRESGGAIDGNIRSLSAKRLQDEGALDLARALHIPLDQVTDAYLGNGDALAKVNAVLGDYTKGLADSGQIEGQVAGENPMAEKASELYLKLKALIPELGEAQAKNKALADAIKNGSASALDASDSGKTLAAAMATLASSTASADQKARALNDALIAMAGGSVNLEAAQFRVADVTARLGDIFAANGTEAEKAAAQAKGYGAALLNADGSLSSATENGRNLRATLQDLTTASADVAQKTFDMARSQGDSIPTATAKAVAAVQLSRDAFVGLAKDLGISSKEAEILADRAGLIPKNAAIAVSTPGSDTTRQELAIIKGLVDAVPPGKDIHMQTISADAEKKLEELGYKVTHMEDGTVVIQGNTGPAQAALNSFLAAPATKTVYIVYSDPGYAGSTQRLAVGNGPGIANGAVLAAAFKNGGLARVTPLKGGVAQMVPPNTWRVVGDRMVDDEAYIPINGSHRSSQILMEAASRMGYQVMKRYAVGGIATTSARGAGGFGDIHFNIDARGATTTAVRMLERETIPKLRMMLVQQVGKRGR